MPDEEVNCVSSSGKPLETAAAAGNSEAVPDSCRMEEAEGGATEEEEGEGETDGVPYDRGWAWAVVLGCFVNYSLYAGYVKCYSLFYVELLHRFHANAAETALFFSMRNAVLSISSLFVMNIVVGHLGERKTTLIGGILISLSGILPSFTNQMMAIICLQGICLGMGQAMVVSPGEVLMGAYFKKRRALVMPLAKCGASIGSVAMPLFVSLFLHTYGLSGALLLTGGLCLHALPAGMLLRPTSYFKKRKKTRRGTTYLDNCNSADQETTRELIPPVHVENQHVTGTKSAVSLASSVPELSAVNRATGLAAQKPYSVSDLSDQRWKRDVPALELEWVVTLKNQGLVELGRHCDGAAVGNSLPNLPDSCNGKGEEGFTRTTEPGGSQDAGSLPRPDRRKRCPRCPGKASGFMLDFSLFRRPLFRLLLAYFVLFNAPNIMCSYLPALASENGVSDSQNGVLLSVIGGLDLVCRLLCAFVANSGLLRVPTIIVIAYVILGVACQFVGLLTSFPHFVALSVLLGVLGGAGNTLLPVLVLEFVGLPHMAKALGFVLLTCGAAAAASFPLLGYIRDVTGSYVSVYHVIGVASILGAGLLCLEKCVRRLEDKAGHRGP